MSKDMQADLSNSILNSIHSRRRRVVEILGGCSCPDICNDCFHRAKKLIGEIEEFRKIFQIISEMKYD